MLALAIAAAVFLGARRCATLLSVDELRARYATPASKFVTVGGVSVHYRDEGGGPIILLLHGSFGNLRTFDNLAAQLRDRYRLIRYDQSPAGLSGVAPAAFTQVPEQFIKEFLGAIGVAHVAILGTSSGGILGYRYAAAYPDDVTALILANVPPSAPVDNAGARRRLPWLTRLSLDVCTRYARRWSRRCWQDFLGSTFTRHEMITDELVSEYFDFNRRSDSRQLNSATAIMRNDAQVVAYLARVRAPTLLLWGEDDHVLQPPTAALMASRLSSTHAEIQLLHTVSHYPPLEAPREVAVATDDFLRRVRGLH